MRSAPIGIVTFLFTDVHGSTRLWEENREFMRSALPRHDSIAQGVAERHDGMVVRARGEGDSLFIVFASASQAIAAAIELQRSFQEERWSSEATLQVRMALHTGEADFRDGDYYGSAVNRAARIRGLAHPGQILISEAVRTLALDRLPNGTTLTDLGTHRLRDLAKPERIYQVEHEGLPSAFPPIQSLSTYPNNLPEQVSQFIGRGKQLHELDALLSRLRLVTLTGTGGTGKTRIALQLGAGVLEQYRNGVWIAELAPISDPDLVVQTVAATLGVNALSADTMLSMVLAWLRDKELLLILDNCEHVLLAAATLVDAIRQECPSVKLLVTSREALGIAGEHVYHIPSLTLPDLKQPITAASLTQCESGRLFVERAMSVNSGFFVKDENAVAIASVCHRLDGIPLALELAAARLRVMTADQIEARLDNRFRLLTGGNRIALPRQQTLRATIDWSYALLSEPDRLLLCRLSVFQGGWRLEDAESVCSTAGLAEDVLDSLTSLVEKSLVVYESPGGRPRYRLLETVRQYGRDRLLEIGESETGRTRHRDHFLALAEEAESHLLGPDQAKWLSFLEDEHENFRAALDWSLSGDDPQHGLRFCRALWRFWMVRGFYTEGRLWCEKSLALGDGSKHTVHHVEVLIGMGNLANQQGDYATAQSCYAESHRLSQELNYRRGMASSLNGLGSNAMIRGDHHSAQTFLEESLALFQVMEEITWISKVLHNLCMVCEYLGELSLAKSYAQESLTLSRKARDAWSEILSLHHLAVIALQSRDYLEACRIARDNFALAEQLGDRRFMATMLNICGEAAIELDDYMSARRDLAASLTINRAMGLSTSMLENVECFANLAVEEGFFERAAILSGVAQSAREELGAARFEQDEAEHKLRMAKVSQALGEEGWNSAHAKGRSMTLENGVDFALQGACEPN